VLFPYTTISLLTLTQKCGKCLFYRPKSVVQIASSYVNNKSHRFLQNALLNSRQFLSLSSHCEHHSVQLCVYLQNYVLRWVIQYRTSVPALFALRIPQDLYCYLDRQNWSRTCTVIWHPLHFYIQNWIGGPCKYFGFFYFSSEFTNIMCRFLQHLRFLVHTLNFWRRNYFLILAHPVYKMWIIQEPNMLELWNKLHIEEKKTESIYHV